MKQWRTHFLPKLNGRVNKDQLRQEYTMVGSIAALAAYYGVTPQRISALIGSTKVLKSPPLSHCLNCHTEITSLRYGLCVACFNHKKRFGKDRIPGVPYYRGYCHKGHRLSDENTYYSKKQRRCRECVLTYLRLRRATIAGQEDVKRRNEKYKAKVAANPLLKSHSRQLARNRYQKLKADPIRYAAYLLQAREYKRQLKAKSKLGS